MGGATSKLAETDWEKADGCLEHDEDTIDRSRPTAVYQSYELIKRSYNQRECDIIDRNKDLLYSTRLVPGTIACFDVLGRDLDTCVLRVNVDLSRRNWIVYSVGRPIFEGQKHDEDASGKFRSDYTEQRVGEGDPPTLYWAAYITVSWSRYSIVATHYGAPTPRMILQYKDFSLSQAVHASSSDIVSDKLDDSPLVQGEDCYDGDNDDEGASPEMARGSVGRRLDGHDDQLDLSDPDSQSIAAKQPVGAERTGDMHASVSMPELAEIEPHEVGNMSLTHSLSDPSFEPRLDHDEWLKAVATESTRHVAEWVKTTSQSLHDATKAFMDSNNKPRHKNHDPLEGVVSLDRPLLLCQEIYTHFVGNHQTSLITKDRALDLLKQDEEMHIRDQDHPQSEEPSIEDELRLAQEKLEQLDASNDTNEKEEAGATSDDDDKPENDSTSTCTGEEQASPTSEQPLVGYWLWENTLRTHKMTLRLAKGSDLALHVVLAIIANQVRYERNAVAMSI